MSTINEPKAKINFDSYPVNPQNEAFKLWWVKLPIDQANDCRHQIKEKCQWSRAVWYNKLHGITSLRLLEMQVIADLAGLEIETMFKIN